MYITGLDGCNYEVDGSEPIRLVAFKKHYPHWGWWIVALLLFWPAVLLCIIVGHTRNMYEISFLTPSGTRIAVWVDEKHYKTLQSAFDVRCS